MAKQTENKAVDGYVSDIIKIYANELDMKIDPKNPTREERLQLALKLDEKGDHGSQWSAMEIMVGRRVDSQEEQYAMLYTVYTMGGMDKRKFYEGFPG